MSKSVFQSGIKRYRAHGPEQLRTGKVMAKGSAVKEGQFEERQCEAKSCQCEARYC